jgi:putative oxidoreductase
MLTQNTFDLALFVLRLVAGLGLAFHGYAKFFRGGKIPGTAGWFESIGMKPGKINALAAASTELGAGLLFAAGFFTPFAGAAFVSLMCVAFWTVHKGNGFLITKEGWEYNLMFATIGVVVSILGPGEWSIDHAFKLDNHLAGGVGLLISLLLGVGAAASMLAVVYRPPAKTESN